MVVNGSGSADSRFDPKTLAEFLEMAGADLRRVLICQVRDDLGRYHDALVSALACPEPERDMQALCKTAHETKGLAATIGAVTLAELAKQVEHACQCQDIAELTRLLAPLAQETAETGAALSNLLSAD